MNNTRFTLISLCFLFSSTLLLNAQSDLILVGLAHANADVKVSEYYVVNDIDDLSIYGVGCAQNGGGTDSIEWSFPAASFSAGDRIIVGTDTAAFEAYFGFEADFYDTGGSAHNFNGNDAFELFKDGLPVDVYGDINVDGDGQSWEYSTTWVYRNCETGPDGTVFVESNWTIAPLDALDNTVTFNTAPIPYPLGSFEPEESCEGLVSEGGTDFIITEFMYNSPGTDIEFLEFNNNSGSNIDLTGYTISDGITYTFPQMSLASGEYTVITNDSLAFLDFYGFSVPEWPTGSLSNGGEVIVVKDSDGNTVDLVDYNDANPWSLTADGIGTSLELCDFNADNNDGANWQRSTTNSGNVINGREVFASPRVQTFCRDFPIVGIESLTTSVNEAEGSINISLYLDNRPDTETSVTLNLSGGSTATADEDFIFAQQTISFPADTDSAEVITIPIIDDNLEEPEETIKVLVLQFQY